MKPFVRAGAITLIGLAVAIFLYPFLHEMGHLVAVMLSGARPQELIAFVRTHLTGGYDSKRLEKSVVSWRKMCYNKM